MNPNLTANVLVCAALLSILAVVLLSLVANFSHISSKRKKERLQREEELREAQRQVESARLEIRSLNRRLNEANARADLVDWHSAKHLHESDNLHNVSYLNASRTPTRTERVAIFSGAFSSGPPRTVIQPFERRSDAVTQAEAVDPTALLWSGFATPDSSFVSQDAPAPAPEICPPPRDDSRWECPAPTTTPSYESPSPSPYESPSPSPSPSYESTTPSYDSTPPPPPSASDW